MPLPGTAGGAVTARRTLASTICRVADPTLLPRPRQLRDASTVMRFRPAHQSMINRATMTAPPAVLGTASNSRLCVLFSHSARRSPSQTPYW